MPPEIAVRPSEGVEVEEVGVSFAFTSCEGLRAVVRKLDEMADSEALRRLLGLVREGI